MASTWFLRAGSSGTLADTFEQSNKAGVGWSDIAGFEDLREIERPALGAALRASGKSASVAAADADELMAFRDGMQVGDILVVPDSAKRQVLVGEIAADYEFGDEPIGECLHLRDVLWLGRADRDGLDPALRTDLNVRRTVRNLEANAEGWASIAQRLRDGEKLAGKRKVSAPRGRLEAIEAERVASERKCPGCGFLKRSTQFDESGVCVDCR